MKVSSKVANEQFQVNSEKTQTSLTREQKEAVGLLSIGTFLEYFDLMLYVHMAVLLNELFLPKTDPFVTNLLNALAFSIPFLLRPVGAYFIGRLGDKIGRRFTVIITTFITSITCLVIATLPTYSDIGIVASCVLMVCRVMQGIASLGEVIGAEIYITEFIKSNVKFQAVTLIYFASVFGGCCALGVGVLSTKYYFNWRIAFLIGAGISFFSLVARSKLREAPEFVDAKLALKRITKNKNKALLNQKINKKNVIALFFIQCTWPIWFYINYFHCQNILKTNFAYSSSDVLMHNFCIALLDLIGIAVVIYLVSKIDPIRILKIKAMIFTPFCLIIPFLLENSSSALNIFFIQSFIALFSISTVPAFPIFIKHIPVLQRFTTVNMTFALSRAFIYVVTSVGFVFLVKNFHHYGLLFIIIPVIIGYIFALNQFEALERAKECD
jgi:MFS transporter, MHS family, proline/betaine transporter